MDDVISRKAAIDVLDKNHILGRGDLNEVLDHIVERLEKLPPAQPEQKTCDGCMWEDSYSYGDCPNCSRAYREDLYQARA